MNINDLNNISNKQKYWGKVESIDDPKRLGRIKVRVNTVFDDIDTENIPFASPLFQDKEYHNLPPVGSVVMITFDNNDKYTPLWYHRKAEIDLLSNDNYTSGTILLNKDLSAYNSDGSVQIWHDDSKGLTVSLTKNDITSNIELRNDNSIYLNNGKKTVHIKDESISIGSEEESKEKATLGESNITALTEINDTIKELKDLIIKHNTLLGNSAVSSPYTAHLKPFLDNYNTEITSTINKLLESNNKAIKKTVSDIVTLD